MGSILENQLTRAHLRHIEHRSPQTMHIIRRSLHANKLEAHCLGGESADNVRRSGAFGSSNPSFPPGECQQTNRRRGVMNLTSVIWRSAVTHCHPGSPDRGMPRLRPRRPRGSCYVHDGKSAVASGGIIPHEPTTGFSSATKPVSPHSRQRCELRGNLQKFQLSHNSGLETGHCSTSWIRHFHTLSLHPGTIHDAQFWPPDPSTAEVLQRDAAALLTAIRNLPHFMARVAACCRVVNPASVKMWGEQSRWIILLPTPGIRRIDPAECKSLHVQAQQRAGAAVIYAPLPRNAGNGILDGKCGGVEIGRQGGEVVVSNLPDFVTIG